MDAKEESEQAKGLTDAFVMEVEPAKRQKTTEPESSRFDRGRSPEKGRGKGKDKSKSKSKSKDKSKDKGSKRSKRKEREADDDHKKDKGRDKAKKKTNMLKISMID